jgi:hypothetical protein
MTGHIEILLGAIFYTVAFITYIFVPWWRTKAGRLLVIILFSLMFVVDYTFVRTWFDILNDKHWIILIYGIITVIGFIIMCAVVFSQLIGAINERHSRRTRGGSDPGLY